MQLTTRRLGRISGALGFLTANLLGAGHALAQPSDLPPPVSISGSTNDDTRTDSGLTRVDAAVLFYQEAGGRVHAIEPVVGVTFNSESGDSLSVRLTTDILTGASPNGAAPSNVTQTFITPAAPPGTQKTVTSASGNSTIVTIPGTGTIARQYTTAPHQLPVDSGFQDKRYAVDVGYTAALDPETRLTLGGGLSTERDYRSANFTLAGSRDFFQKTTTLSAGYNFEYDQSMPTFGAPTPFGVMSADPKGGNKTKTVNSVVVGVTQVVNRYWLAQLSYNIGFTKGYQTDPYRLISVVDGVTGAPVRYLYESRPESRVRQSVYLGNKIAIGPTFADISARAYHDSWGINSVSFEAADRVPITSWFYVEPSARYYRQTKADFFHGYLVNGQALPGYATSDSRLDQFSAVTLGLKLGLKVGHTGEFYIQADDYKQSGTAHPANAIGELKNENLFGGVDAKSVVVGFTYAFW
jgi:hypothetical protein